MCLRGRKAHSGELEIGDSEESVHTVTQGKNKKQSQKEWKIKIPTQPNIKCFFYKKKRGHMKKDCIKYKV